MIQELSDLGALRRHVEDVRSAHQGEADLAPFRNEILDAYRIRSVEQGFLKAFGRGQMNGTVHTCVGQEFSATAICSQLGDEDWITSNHRCHGHFIAKTGDWRGLIDELLGKADGICKGIGSSQHLYRKGFLSNGPQGALLPVGTGIGLHLKEYGNVVVSYIGEGTLGEGITYEALNLAALLGSPQVFVCENNFYSQSTPQAVNTSGGIAARFEAFGVRTFVASTWDLPGLYKAAEEAVRHARYEQQPAALLLHTYRLNAHSKGDDDREAEEVSFFREADLLTVAAELSAFEEDFARIDEETDDAFRRSLQKPELDFHDYAADQLPREPAGAYAPAPAFEGRVIERVNAFLKDQAAAGKLIIGEDIADPYGGAFKATKGIGEAYPDRVISTPISEAGLVGIAAGYSLAGGRAIAEIMFGDFMTYCFDQIVNGISKYHHMYGLEAQCPVMIRTPMGGKRGYGPTHSQSLEKYLCGIDNVLTVALNSLTDPKAVLDACQAEPAPKIVIENKVDYGKKAPALNDNLELLAGETPLAPLLVRPRHNRSHFTIVTYGEPARMVLDDYERIHRETDSIFDLFCLVQLYPLDLGEIFRHVDPQGHLLIVEDGSTPFGIGAEIAAQFAEREFGGRVRRLGAHPVPIPSPKSLESQSLVTTERVIAAVLELLDG